MLWKQRYTLSVSEAPAKLVDGIEEASTINVLAHTKYTRHGNDTDIHSSNERFGTRGSDFGQIDNPLA